METYTAMRHFADSWGLVFMFVVFVGVILFTLRPGAKASRRRCRANSPEGGLRHVRKTH
jgi:cytochrome c oxidase cbb3-type subunit 4